MFQLLGECSTHNSFRTIGSFSASSKEDPFPKGRTLNQSLYPTLEMAVEGVGASVQGPKTLADLYERDCCFARMVRAEQRSNPRKEVVQVDRFCQNFSGTVCDGTLHIVNSRKIQKC